jgi:hypothetical protein
MKASTCSFTIGSRTTGELPDFFFSLTSNQGAALFPPLIHSQRPP